MIRKNRTSFHFIFNLNSLAKFERESNIKKWQFRLRSVEIFFSQIDVVMSPSIYKGKEEICIYVQHCMVANYCSIRLGRLIF